MGLIFSTNPVDWVATDGVSVALVPQPATPRIVGERTVRIVGNFPWGDTNKIIEIGEADDFINLMVGQTADPAAYEGYRAIANRTFGPFEVVRIEGAGAAEASRTVRDSLDAEDLFSVTAKSKGAAGNEITVLFTQVSAELFNLQITWGESSQSYTNLPRTLAAFDGIDNPWVDLVWLDTDLSGALPASDASPVALTGGSDGVIDDEDYIGSPTSKVGLRVFEDAPDGGLYFLAEYTSATAITALRAHNSLKNSLALAQADASNDFDANEAAAELISDGTIGLPLHRTQTIINGAEYTVDFTSYVASVWSQKPPHYSVADADYADSLQNIIGLPAGVSINRPEWIRAELAGGMTIERPR